MEEVLNRNKIFSKFSTPYEHWGNGMIERTIGIIQDGVRTLMIQSGASPSSWQDATEYYVRMMNECRLSPGKDKTPHEIFYDEKPTFDGKVEFYTQGMAFLSPDERGKGKNAPRAQPVTMVGYDDRYKVNTWKLLTKDRKEIIRSNVVWNPREPPEKVQARNCKIESSQPSPITDDRFTSYNTPFAGNNWPGRSLAPTDPFVELARRLSDQEQSNWPKSFGEALLSPDRAKWLDAIKNVLIKES
jgi:hypothetical protein